jgi:hypothetical protein
MVGLHADWRSRNRKRVIEYERQYRRRDPAKYLWGRLRQRANKKGVPFSLTVDEIARMIEATPVCPVLGMPLETVIGSDKGGGRDNSMSFDRFVPKLGYASGNVTIISQRANTIKRDATLDELKRLVQWMEQRPIPKE